jgi:hypothetical protein
MNQALLLLPAWSAFGRQTLAADIARALGRADALPPAAAGNDAQLQRHFACTPAHWAPAALTRQAECGDAAGVAWLRADPAHVRPDINGARLLGLGERLGLDREDVDALLPALRPLFGDTGFALDAPTPARWYLRLPREAKLPAFSAPDAALGEDLFEHLPDGPEARRWRALQNEVQIVLHNHLWNARRAERGRVPVNALWLWGGGVLPERVACALDRVHGDDDVLRALAHVAGVSAAPAGAAFAPAGGRALHDLRRQRDLAALQRDWLRPALDALRAGSLEVLELDSADGVRLRMTRGQRWRFWRGAWAPAAAADA